MLSDEYMPTRALAVADFNRLRRQAALQDIVGRLKGEPSELLSYEEARQRLKGQEMSRRTLEDIPLDAIVGSTGRYREFNRGFLPRGSISPERWASVKLAMTGLSGVPPIEVYRIGQAYFVQDGNHRVSVARQLGLKTIQGYVTEVRTRVPLTADVKPADLILAAERTEFLERTRLDQLLPQAELRVTATGQYPVLLEHIDVHRYFMGLDQQREISCDEAVVHWYETVYQPLAQLIREHGLLRDFPHRTEADMYLWLCRHRAELAQALGWDISADAAASDLSSRAGHYELPPNPASERLQQVLTVAADSRPPPPVVDTPPIRADRIVDDLLVAINGELGGWRALEAALHIARQEGARLHGLHVVPADDAPDDEQFAAVRNEFERRCRTAGIAGKLAFETGNTVNGLCRRARWADLVVTPLTQPDTDWTRTTLGSGFSSLLKRCPRPVLAVPCPGATDPTCDEPVQPPQRALLAYDGSIKAQEALSVAVYMAGWWNVALSILMVDDDPDRIAELQSEVREQLDRHSVQGRLIVAESRVVRTILLTARNEQSDLILMGGYGRNAALKWVLGSAVDGVLRSTEAPVLVCQ